MMYMKKAENEKSTVLPGNREKTSGAESVFTIRKQESAFGSRQCDFCQFDEKLKAEGRSMARTRR